MLSRSAKRTRLIAIAKVMPAAPMRRRRLFFLAKIYPFSPSCLTSPSTRMPTLPVAECLARGFAMSSSLLLLTQDCVSPDQSQPRVEIVLRGLLNETLHHPTDRLRSPLEAAPQRRSLRGRTARPLRPAAALRQQQPNADVRHPSTAHRMVNQLVAPPRVASLFLCCRLARPRTPGSRICRWGRPPDALRSGGIHPRGSTPRPSGVMLACQVG